MKVDVVSEATKLANVVALLDAAAALVSTTARRPSAAQHRALGNVTAAAK